MVLGLTPSGFYSLCLKYWCTFFLRSVFPKHGNPFFLFFFELSPELSLHALELFKKALPTPQASFVQLTSRMSSVRARALATVRSAAQRSPGLDLIALALHGKTGGFEVMSFFFCHDVRAEATRHKIMALE